MVKKEADMTEAEIIKQREYARQYYQNNKDKFIASDKRRNNTLIKCDACGIVVSLNYLAAHNITKKHINNVENNKPFSKERQVMLEKKNMVKLTLELENTIKAHLQAIEQIKASVLDSTDVNQMKDQDLK